MDPNSMYTHNTTNAVNDVNPNPIYRQNNTKPNDPNKGADLPCNQSPTDTHQQGDEAAFGPSDNDGNHCLQPYAVTLQQDVQTASIVMPEDNEDNPCIQPDAVTHGEEEGPILGPVDCGDSQEDDDCGSTVHTTRDNEGHPCIQPDVVTPHEDDKMAIESGNCGVVQPYVVQYEEDETFGESANNENNPCIQPYAVTHQEDQEPSNNCDGGQPYAVRYHKHDDSGRETVSIASDDEDIQAYAAAYMYECDMYECDKTSRDAQTSLSLSSQNQNQPKVASNSINDVSTSPSSNDALHALDPNPTYAAADTCQGDVERNTASEDTQESLSSQNQPPAASNINDASDVLHALNPNPMYVPNVRHPATCGRTPRLVCLATAVVLGSCIVGGVILLFYLSTNPPQMVDRSRARLHDTGKPVIAMDTRNNKVIVGEGDTIRLFHRNGTLYRCFKGLTDYKARRTGIGGIALDKKGNILLTDGHKSVKKYSPSGVKICEFGTIGGAKGRLRFPVGVCVDTSGRIIVVNSGHNRVDMFTSRAEFVRTIVEMEEPFAIAMGPDGQMVVTGTDTVTIFPRRMVFA
ncbi:hypothetical protein Bbelb_251850 [Branchiostoma belcheri]|nr:hypothetical protein Bbelb_251850 [Branchiostoma belcheri]